ncbi:MAG: hypothetical protein AB7T16_13725 [Dehalococcoidia bacterium]
MHAALALRAAYVHAAETLLALLLGSVQAPDCLLRWMHLYQPGDLRSMIKKIDAYERFPSKLNATRVTREQIAAAVFSPLVLDDKDAPDAEVPVAASRKRGSSATSRTCGVTSPGSGRGRTRPANTTASSMGCASMRVAFAWRWPGARQQ